jgi:chemotaxis protein methyltransferase CheR
VVETSVSAEEYAFIADLLCEQCAFVLAPGKGYLLKSRLTPVARRHHLESIRQLIERLRTGGRPGLTSEVVEAMVTTETSFFRDMPCFESLKQIVLPELIARRRSQRQLKIWCAAGASGQEPYSIALLLKEYCPELVDWELNLTATDISHEMLRRARAASYSQLEINRGLPTHLLQKWFRQEGAHWRLDDRIRNMVTLSHINLAQPWPAMPTWDLVVLRNVLIYLNDQAKREILGRVARVLSRDGYLLLGGTETTIGLDNSFARVETLASGYYQLKP